MRPDQNARNAGRGSLAIGLAGLIALFLVTLFPPDLAAQSAGVIRITSSFGTGPKPVGFYEFSGTFTCDISSGDTGTCTGGFNAVERDENCSNAFQFSGDTSIAGIDLSRTGPFQAVATFTHVDFHPTTRPDGSCTFVLGPLSTQDIPFTGTWNGTTGTFAMPTSRDSHGNPIAVTGSFTAYRNAPAPVFPMTVRSNISSTSATATADIQFRAQDVGKSGSIYTFAAAPANLVMGGLEAKAMVVGIAKDARNGERKDGPPACVLAQLSSTGQLVAVTYAQLQAYSSGTLSAQGAAVSILNNTSTPAVAGATFYVGYGASSAAMIDEGLYRSAVTVPGTSVCPMLSSQTALWWNHTESGWGVNFNHQGNILFGTLFTYDANRTPLWLFMSNGAMQSDGATFTGELYRATGSAFNANPFTPISLANLTSVGTMTASFVDVNSGTLRYTVNGVEVTKAIERQVYGSRAASCLPTLGSRATATNYQDLWWNAPADSESGWGINITHQDNILFATLFTYDASGRDLWLVMSKGERQTDGSYLGILYRASGPPFNANPFTPITPADLADVGTMRLRFSDGNNGTLTYTYNGAPVTKAITRQVFSSPVPDCH